jgi:glycosyltransferase involved in cell wall biosynthesis
MKYPLVSCTMLTANRQKYVPLAIDNFIQQTYPNKELIIIDDGKNSVLGLIPNDERIKYFYELPTGTIGAKRNYACARSSGAIIMHWDDDDWYAPDWIDRQVEYLIESKADMCGIEHVHFFSPISDTFWTGTPLNRNKGYRQQWVSGATLAYWKIFWETHPFEHRNTGEDDSFITKHAAKVFAHDYIDGFVAILHAHNTTTKYFEHPIHKGHSKQPSTL